MEPFSELLPSPPWNWSGLSGEDLRAAWESLAGWVEALRDDYRDWVALPDCWPLHEPLRSELLFFKCWQERVLRLSDDPEDGIRWHSELRRAAEAWSRLALCDHAGQNLVPGWSSSGPDPAALAGNLQLAIQHSEEKPGQTASL
jgi:hypothetical protein